MNSSIPANVFISGFTDSTRQHKATFTKWQIGFTDRYLVLLQLTNCSKIGLVLKANVKYICTQTGLNFRNCLGHVHTGSSITVFLPVHWRSVSNIHVFSVVTEYFALSGRAFWQKLSHNSLCPYDSYHVRVIACSLLVFTVMRLTFRL